MLQRSLVIVDTVKSVFFFNLKTNIIIDPNPQDADISEKTAKIIMVADGSIPKIWLILDSEATDHVIFDKLVKNIRKSKKGCHIYGTRNKFSNACASMEGIRSRRFLLWRTS